LIDVSATPFTMGSPETELGRSADEVAHQVTLTRNYMLMTTEVTQEQFENIMGYNPAHFGPNGSGTDCGPTCPVEQVSWDECAAYGNVLSRREGVSECYDCSGTGRNVECTLSPNYASPYDCPGYRLPTEAEWEYAARAGSTTATYRGDLDAADCVTTTLHEAAWYSCNSEGTTHAVAQMEPNVWTLRDMLGNVYEWVHDVYGPYPPGAVTDPTGAVGEGFHVVRGGAWHESAFEIRASYRAFDEPPNHIGCRMARSQL
jgi:formylglycine-generating enzyme required for sulfatase activity